MEGQRLDPRQVGRNVVMTAAIAGLGGLLLLIEALGRGGAFLFYAAICVVTFFFCRRLVPETKGKHLEDITAVFEQRVAKHSKPRVGGPPTDKPEPATT